MATRYHVTGNAESPFVLGPEASPIGDAPSLMLFGSV